MLASKDQITKPPKKEASFKLPWNSSTRTLKKEIVKQEPKIVESSPISQVKKFTRTTRPPSRQPMSPALSTSSSFTRLNEVEHKIQLNTLTSSLMKQQQQQQQRRSVSFAVAAHSAFGKERQDTLDEKKTKMNDHQLQQAYEKLLSSSQNISDRELKQSIKQLRLLVSKYGLPETLKKEGTNTLRCRVWKIFLGVYKINAQEYCHLIEKGATDLHEKIKNDTFRTMPTSKEFTELVDEDMLSRVLNAFVWKTREQPQSRLLNYTYSYVQGMNVIAAPFLYVMPELDAFHTMSNFIQNYCPLYFQPALEGVHCGVKLLDTCMQIIDPDLYKYLKGKGLGAKVYAFPSVMTFCACTPPLNQVLALWDFLLAYGVHLSILCIIAQIILIKEDILKSASPMKLLRTLPELKSSDIISIVLKIVVQLPEDVYDTLARHPYDPVICDMLLSDDSDEL